MDASNEALSLNPKNTKALFRRANAYANLNFIEEAMDALNTAHSIDPDDAVSSLFLNFSNSDPRARYVKGFQRFENLSRKIQ